MPIEILRSTEYVTLPNGLRVTRPSRYDWRRRDMLTAEQEKLFNQFCQLTSSEEDQGKALTIERKITELELKKHPLLRVWNEHLQVRSL